MKMAPVPFETRMIFLENLIDRLDFSKIFKNQNPLHIDLGAGDGGFTASMAKQYPERNFLGVERLKGRAIKIAKKSLRLDLPNLRVLRLESSYLMQWLLRPDSIEVVHLLCPDPWPKRKQQRFRLIQHEFVSHLALALQAGGYFHFATDHEEYFQTGCQILSQNSALKRIQESPWGELPKTDFEKQWEAQGRSVLHSFWRKNEL